jgi:hypothetical protein
MMVLWKKYSHSTLGAKTALILIRQSMNKFKKAIISSLSGEPLTLTELFGSIEKNISPVFEGKIGWYSHAVKQDLEARKLIERTSEKPQKYKLV